MSIEVNINDLTEHDLRAVLAACVLNAIKDLQSCKAYIPSQYSLSEPIRTAWLMIFDPRYRMKFGDLQLSFEEIIDLVCQISDDSIVDDFRNKLGAQLQCYPQK